MSRAWIAGSVLYGLVRAALVWRYLSSYGVNAAVFTAVEAVTSLVYGWASSRLVLAVIDRRWRTAAVSAVPALLAYLAPDAYVFLSVGELPAGTRRVLVAIVVTTCSITLAGLSRQILHARRAHAPQFGG